MKNYLLVALLIVCTFLAGCSKGKENVDSELPVEQSPENEVKQDEEEQNNQMQESLDKSLLQNISSVENVQSVEDLAELSPGSLTSEFTVEEETSMWAKTEVPSELRPAFLSEMKEVVKDTEDPAMIVKALNYYLGGAQYKELVDPLITYHPSFTEPLMPEPYEMNEEGERTKHPAKALILLDASSSMLLYADGRLKMDTAKSAVKSFATAIGQKSEVSLYAYGHKGTQSASDKTLSCGTIEEVYPLGEFKEKEFNSVLDNVKASGWTPLAEAIKQAGIDHKDTTEDLTVYIVSDGAETCGGDPIAEAKAFTQGKAGRHVNVIGFQVDKDAESQLKAVAEAGNGTYMAANSLEEMTAGISKIWLPSDLDLVGLVYAKPIGWPKTTALTTVSDYSNKAKKAIKVENNRLIGAAKLLKDEALVSDSQEEEFITFINDQKDAYQKLIDDLEVEKRKLVEDEVDRIVKKIDDYQARMKELKKQNAK
ncbi:hypothetical protein [Sporosarcina sp. OR05]|uniref:hypothetical protein n=1 Tax=Sporosarcina sp. OR05 TaxID=2969819 RepID=UPI00352A7FB3